VRTLSTTGAVAGSISVSPTTDTFSKADAPCCINSAAETSTTAAFTSAASRPTVKRKLRNRDTPINKQTSFSEVDSTSSTYVMKHVVKKHNIGSRMHGYHTAGSKTDAYCL
jgi:hypothetical protein